MFLHFSKVEHEARWGNTENKGRRHTLCYLWLKTRHQPHWHDSLQAPLCCEYAPGRCMTQCCYIPQSHLPLWHYWGSPPSVSLVTIPYGSFFGKNFIAFLFPLAKSPPHFQGRPKCGKGGGEAPKVLRVGRLKLDLKRVLPRMTSCMETIIHKMQR